MRLDKFTLRGQEAIQAGIELAERNQNQQVEPEHILCAMLEQPEGIVRPLLGKLGANVQVVLNDCQAAVARFPRVQGGQQYFSSRLNQIFTAAEKQAEKMQDEYISTEHLLLAIADEKDGAAGKLLRQHGVNRDDLLKAIEQTSEMLFEQRKTPKILVEIFLAIKPPVNVAPRARPTIDYRQIGFADEFIEQPVSLREEIAQFDVGVGSDPRQPVADAAGCAVVTFSITDGEEQDFLHDSLGKRRPKRNGRKFNGYLHRAK